MIKVAAQPMPAVPQALPKNIKTASWNFLPAVLQQQMIAMAATDLNGPAFFQLIDDRSPILNVSWVSSPTGTSSEVLGFALIGLKQVDGGNPSALVLTFPHAANTDHLLTSLFAGLSPDTFGLDQVFEVSARNDQVQSWLNAKKFFNVIKSCP